MVTATNGGSVDLEALWGTWRLAAYAHLLDGGEAIFPFGPDARGQLMYGSDGRMAVAIMRAARPCVVEGGPFDGTTEELADAARTFFGYAGRYELRGDQVLHHVEISLIARWTGTTEARQIALQDGQLVLTTPRFISAGIGQVARLQWTRMASAS